MEENRTLEEEVSASMSFGDHVQVDSVVSTSSTDLSQRPTWTPPCEVSPPMVTDWVSDNDGSLSQPAMDSEPAVPDFCYKNSAPPNLIMTRTTKKCWR